jgi:hypothetical protein
MPSAFPNLGLPRTLPIPTSDYLGLPRITVPKIRGNLNQSEVIRAHPSQKLFPALWAILAADLRTYYPFG